MISLIKWVLLFLLTSSVIYIVGAVYNSSFMPFDWSSNSKIGLGIILAISLIGTINKIEHDSDVEERRKRNTKKS